MAKAARVRLIEERKRRQWSQQEVANLLGTTRHNVSRWESGTTTPGPYFRARLCELFGKKPQDLGLFTKQISGEQRCAPAPNTPPCVLDQYLPSWHIPYPRNPFFTGRLQILQTLHAALTQQNDVPPLTRSYALRGLGGIGKTQIALEYAYRYASAHTALLWVNAQTRETLLASFISIAEMFSLLDQAEQDGNKIIQAVTRWLGKQKGWLLIFDNVEDLTLLPQFLPPTHQGSLLVTTRLQALGTLAQPITVEPLIVTEAVLFLLQRAKLLPPGMAPMHLSPTDMLTAQTIVEEMAGLPLALDQAGAYIEETQCSLGNYLQHYLEQRLRLLDRRGNSCQDHPASVQTTLSLSLQQVEQRSLVAAEILRFCAFLVPDAIPEEVIAVGFPACSEHLQALAVDPWQLDEAIAVLGNYSLVHRNSATNTLSLHRIVQAVVQDSLPRQEQEEWIKRVITALNLVFPEVKHATWKQCERLVPHALQCAKWTTHWEQINSELATLLLKTGYYLTMEQHRYREAEPLLQRALQMRESALGIEHLLVAEALNSVGLVYTWQGKYAAAEPLFQRALQIREQKLGIEHPAVVQPLNNLGSLYAKQGKYAEAESLLQRAVHVKEQPQDNKLILLLNNLANLYQKQGKCAEAEPLLQRALQIEEQKGIDDPDVAYTLSNLAHLNAQQGKYAEAEHLFVQALQIRKRALGNEHLRITPMLSDLGNLYLEQGKYREAEPLLQQALRIKEQTLGSEHPDVADGQFAFARFYLGQQNFIRAQQYYQQAMATWEKTLGLDHPLVLNSVNQYQLMSKQLIDDLKSSPSN